MLKALINEGWAKKQDGKTVVYKVLFVPCGIGSRQEAPPKPQYFWERPEGIEIQEFWMPLKQVSLEWLQKMTAGPDQKQSNIETQLALDTGLKDGWLSAVFNEEGGPECLNLPRNYVIGEWMEDMEACWYGNALVLPTKLL